MPPNMDTIPVKDREKNICKDKILVPNINPYISLVFFLFIEAKSGSGGFLHLL